MVGSRNHKPAGGQSTIEVLIAVGTFALLAAGLLQLVASPLTLAGDSANRFKASTFADQGVEAARAVKESGWTHLSTGTHGLARSGGTWSFSGFSDVPDTGFVRSVVVADVARDVGGAIVTGGGTVDPRTKSVTVTVSWTFGVVALPRSVTRSVYLTDWNVYDWTQTTDADFSAGSRSGLTISGTGSAAQVELSPANKSWTSGGGTLVVHTTDADWNGGSYGTNTQETGTGSTASVTELGASAWSGVSQAKTWNETTDTDFSDGTFSQTAVVDTGDLAGVGLNTQIDWAPQTSPTTNDMYTLGAVSANDVWAVGSAGTIAHWNGSAWSAVSSPTSQGLHDVDCLTAANCWAVADAGQIIRWNGTSWTNFVDTGAEVYNGVTMTSTTDGWAVAGGTSGTARGRIFRWNGTAWSQFVDLGSQNLSSIDCTGTSDCWASADSGQIFHWNGTAWSQFVDTGSETWNDLNMVSPTDGWIVGEGGAMRRFNGTSWNTVSSGVTGSLGDVECVSSTYCLVVSDGTPRVWNGTGWSAMSFVSGVTLYGLAVISSGSSFGIGAGGAFVNYGTHYFPNGTYLSGIFDAGSAQTWGTASWDAVLVSATGVTIATRSASTPAGIGSAAWSAEMAVSGSAITSAANRYLQYRITLATPNRSATPRLNAITISYAAPAVADYEDLYMAADNDGWSFGSGGAIARWDGTGWSKFSSPTVNLLEAAAGTASTDVWAMGASGTIVHWNGTAWSVIVSGTAQALHGAACLTSGNCRTVGASGTILRWNGTAWSAEADPSTQGLEAVGYTAANDVWAVGGTDIVRFNGASWSVHTTVAGAAFHGLWMVSATDGWTVGGGGAIRRWNGTAWSTVTSPTTNALRDVHCASASDCWAVGDAGTIIHWNGTAWSTAASPTGQAIEAVFMSGGTHGWAVAHATTFLEYRTVYPGGAAWTSPIIDGGAAGTTWNSVAWDQSLPLGTGITIASRSGPNPTCCTGWSSYSAEYASPGGSPVTSPANRYFQYRTTFTTANTVSTGVLQEVRILRGAATAQPLYGIQGTAASDVWAVGEAGTILRYDGASWSATNSPVTTVLHGLDALTSANAIAVGYGGVILKMNGSAWSAMSSPTNEELYAVDLLDATHGWAVGTGGAIVSYNGTTWSTIASGTGSPLYGVSMVSASNGFAVGGGGTIRRWNGTSWSTSASPTIDNLNDVFCLNASLCWAVGDNGRILSWNGTVWSVTTSPVASRLNAVEARSGGEVWAVGDFGTILKYDGVSWASYVSPTTRDLYSVAVSAPTDGWISGNAGELIKDPIAYVGTGTLFSSVLDTDSATSTFQTAFWNAITPANTALRVSARNGNTSSPDGSWSGWGPYFSSATGSPIALPSARYLQYQLTLSTSDTSMTPSVQDLTMTYE